jgi:hypothetical protein
VSKATKAAEFIRNLSGTIESAPAAAAPTAANEAAPKPKARVHSSRVDRKHIGAYFDDETVEKVAILRARLRMDNTELLKLAIDDLYRKQAAKKAFGD